MTLPITQVTRVKQQVTMGDELVGTRKSWPILSSISCMYSPFHDYWANAAAFV
jgi:hypothetical protein